MNWSAVFLMLVLPCMRTILGESPTPEQCATNPGGLCLSASVRHALMEPALPGNRDESPLVAAGHRLQTRLKGRKKEAVCASRTHVSEEIWLHQNTSVRFPLAPVTGWTGARARSDRQEWEENWR